MPHCSSCNKNPATILVLDVDDGELASERHLCAQCAQEAGVGAKQGTALKPSLTALLTKAALPQPTTDHEVTCPGCQLTSADFRARGRFGCPRCYEVFRTTLVPLLERVHDATSHRGRMPAGDPSGGVERRAPGDRSELQRQLEDAIQAENYEAAAKIRDRMVELFGDDGVDP